MSNKNITKSNCFIFHDVGVKTINNFVIIRNIKFCDDSVGIIDTYISEKYDNVIEKNAVVHGKKIKHGDLLIEFLRDCGYNGQIYASYSNLKNSIDYPAMYKNVIGCGYAKGELNKAIDNMYKSNRIIVWNNGLAYYKGNSSLSIQSSINPVFSRHIAY